MRRHQPRLCGYVARYSWLLLLPALWSCAASQPPVASSGADAALMQRLQERAQQVQTLTALVAVSYRLGERQGTFDLAVNYAAPGQLRFTALKDTLLRTQVLFDLVLQQQHYHVHTQDNTLARQGLVVDFVRDMPTFRTFAILGEAFFLPGLQHPEAPQPQRARGAAFSTRLPNGALAAWVLDPASMEISQGRLQWQGITVMVQYLHYRQIDGIPVPEHVIIQDRQIGFQAEAVLKEIDMNHALPGDIFQLAARAL